MAEVRGGSPTLAADHAVVGWNKLAHFLLVSIIAAAAFSSGLYYSFFPYLNIMVAAAAFSIFLAVCFYTLWKQERATRK